MDQNISMPILTAAELMKLEFPPPQWLVEGLLPEGLTVLSGAPKIGKSWLSLQIALSITTASPLFGRAPASEKNVLLLALEDNERRLQERISKCRLTASGIATVSPRFWEGGFVSPFSLSFCLFYKPLY